MLDINFSCIVDENGDVWIHENIKGDNNRCHKCTGRGRSFIPAKLNNGEDHSYEDVNKYSKFEELSNVRQILTANWRYILYISDNKLLVYHFGHKNVEPMTDLICDDVVTAICEFYERCVCGYHNDNMYHVVTNLGELITMRIDFDYGPDCSTIIYKTLIARDIVDVKLVRAHKRSEIKRYFAITSDDKTLLFLSHRKPPKIIDDVVKVFAHHGASMFTYVNSKGQLIGFNLEDNNFVNIDVPRKIIDLMLVNNILGYILDETGKLWLFSMLSNFKCEYQEVYVNTTALEFVTTKLTDKNLLFLHPNGSTMYAKVEFNPNRQEIITKIKLPRMTSSNKLIKYQKNAQTKI